MNQQADKKEPLFAHNLVLIGFMGAGKSAVARAFHNQYGMEVIEMDQIISQREGMPISEIFRVHGEQYFRDAETDLLVELQKKTHAVISCGGGTPLREVNVAEMKKNGTVVLLAAEPETIFQRVKDNHDRPLLENNKTVSYIAELLDQRLPKYEAAADIVIRTDQKTTAQICEEIIQKLQAGSQE